MGVIWRDVDDPFVSFVYKSLILRLKVLTDST